MRIIKDKRVNTGEVLFNLNHSNPIAVQVLSGLPNNKDDNTINGIDSIRLAINSG